MPVDRVHQALQGLVVGRGVQLHVHADAFEAGTHAVVDGEETTKVDIALHRHRHPLEWNPERGREGAIGDFLAGAERGEDEFDRRRARIATADAVGFVDGQRMVAQADFGAKARAQPRRRREGRPRPCGIAAEFAVGGAHRVG